MHTTPQGPLQEALPTQPLGLTIPEPTYENVALRALIRQAIPMLRTPEAHSPAVRRQLAETLARALRPDLPRSSETSEDAPPHTDAEAPQEYEPGCDTGENWT